jgi:hypothetical protein
MLISSSNLYYIEYSDSDTEIILKNGNSWPTHTNTGNGVRIRFTSGYADIPEDLVNIIMSLTSFIYENRCAPDKLPTFIETRLFKYKILM